MAKVQQHRCRGQSKTISLRRFPPDWHQAAVDRGADALVSDAAWILRGRPRALRAARLAYRRCCVELFRLSHKPRRAV